MQINCIQTAIKGYLFAEIENFFVENIINKYENQLKQQKSSNIFQRPYFELWLGMVGLSIIYIFILFHFIVTYGGLIPTLL